MEYRNANNRLNLLDVDVFHKLYIHVMMYDTPNSQK